MEFPSSLRPMRHRDFSLVWWSGMVSNAGSWMQTVAVGAFVTAKTGKAGWAGLAAAAAFLPIGLLAPVGGALADRLDRRRFIMVASVGEAAMATLLAWMAITERAHPGSVTVVVFVAGCIGALRLPFNQAMVLDLVPRDEILAAAGLTSAQYNLGRVFGPSLAGGVIALWGYGWAFTINAASFFAVIAAMALVRVTQERVLDMTPLWTRIRIGARAARANPGARAAIVLIAFVALTVSPFIALIPARAYELAGGAQVRHLHPDAFRQSVAAITGYLTTAQGVGAVIGALAITTMATRFGRRRMLLLNVIAAPIAVCAYALVGSTLLAVIALGVVGMLYIGILSGANTVVQLWAPTEFRGRILSLYLVALGALYPLGGLAHGWIADRIGLARTTCAAAGLMLLILLVWRVLSPGSLTPLTDPAELGVDPESINPQPMPRLSTEVP
jgi:MFS family permease